MEKPFCSCNLEIIRVFLFSSEFGEIIRINLVRTHVKDLDQKFIHIWVFIFYDEFSEFT